MPPPDGNNELLNQGKDETVAAQPPEPTQAPTSELSGTKDLDRADVRTKVASDQATADLGNTEPEMADQVGQTSQRQQLVQPVDVAAAEEKTREAQEEWSREKSCSESKEKDVDGEKRALAEEDVDDDETNTKLAHDTQKLAISDADGSKLTEKERVRSPSPPPLPPKDDKFLQRVSSEKAPAQQQQQDQAEYFDEKQAYVDDAVAEADVAAAEGDESAYVDDERSEIASIMGQFEGDGAELERLMSHRLEIPPPRTSSLDPLPHLHNIAGSSHHDDAAPSSPALHRTKSRESQVLLHSPKPVSARPASISGLSISGQQDSVASPRPQSTIFQPPPPSPDPEPPLPFDFHRFLEQLRHRTADPVARFLRSFLMEFAKKQWMVHEQVKIIQDFLEFISKKMAQCEVWRTVSDAEFDNAREGMEKLVMNRLYNQTFSPAIPPVEVMSPAKGRRARTSAQSSSTPGRRGQHQEDVERDVVIAQKIRIYGWIKEEHLDLAPVTDKGRKFLVLAQQELLKINSYRAPRDKVICILNCCKVIFGFLKNAKSDQSADSFVPLLIYTVLRANPEHLVSNVQYILRFRNQDKLGGEAGYYISSLMGVVTFVENLDRTNLTITDEEFERNVEEAVSAIAEGHKAEEYESTTHDGKPKATAPAAGTSTTPQSSAYQPSFTEKTGSRPQVTPRNSTDAERSTVSPKRVNSNRGPRSSTSTEDGEDNAAVAGLLRTIQKPLSTIGRIFSDENSSASSSGQQGQHPALTPQPGNSPRLSPGPRPLQRKSSEETRTASSGQSAAQRASSTGAPAGPRRTESQTDAREEDKAARQAGAEAAEVQRIRAQEHRVVVETLQGMFPDLDRDVISDVVRMKEGRVGLAVDACLALSN